MKIYYIQCAVLSTFYTAFDVALNAMCIDNKKKNTKQQWHCLYKRPISACVEQMSQMDPRDPQDIQISDFK